MDYFNAPSEVCNLWHQMAEAAAPKGSQTAPDLGHVSIYYTSQKGVEKGSFDKISCITMGFCNTFRYIGPISDQPKIEETGLRNEAPTEQLKPNRGQLEVSND
jgi:hypothetical protein